MNGTAALKGVPGSATPLWSVCRQLTRDVARRTPGCTPQRARALADEVLEDGGGGGEGEDESLGDGGVDAGALERWRRGVAAVRRIADRADGQMDDGRGEGCASAGGSNNPKNMAFGVVLPCCLAAKIFTAAKALKQRRRHCRRFGSLITWGFTSVCISPIHLCGRL